MTDTVARRDRRNQSLVTAYERSIDQITRDLRRLADEVEHNRTPNLAYKVNDVTHAPNRPYLAGAMSVTQSIHNALPNLNLSLLIERAYDVETLTENDA